MKLAPSLSQKFVPAPNQLRRELLSVLGLSPWDQHNSSSRKQMFASHVGQCLVIKGATERYVQTGMEQEYGKYTFSVKMPSNGRIIKVIDRYRRGYGDSAIALNPQSIVLFHDEENDTYDMLDLRGHTTHHTYFGFENKKGPAYEDLISGKTIGKGQIILDSPSKTPDGGYKYGIQLNIAYMTHPGVAEDGIIISRDRLQDLAYKKYETRVVSFGKSRMPLNIYGDETNYKPFPDIGEYVRDDGLLMATRTYDKDLAIVEQSIYDLMEPDYTFDQLTYADGAGGRVVDIRVMHDPVSRTPSTPQGMEVQPEKYNNARLQFYKDIIVEYNKLRRQRQEGLQISPALHRLVLEAHAVTGEGLNYPVIKLFHHNELDDWRVEFVIEYEHVPDIGNKLTGCHGNKGVICHIAEPHEMPVDADGNRADVIMDPKSVISRMNLGTLYEQYINAASRDVVKTIMRQLNIPITDRNELRAAGRTEKPIRADFLERLDLDSPDRPVTKAFEYLLGYYQICSPKQYNWFATGQYKGSIYQHLAHVINERTVFLYMPPDNEPESDDIVRQLEAQYRPTYGPVSYIGYSGRRVTTKTNVRIGSAYFLLLEKVADDWTATASAKTQHYGVVAQVSNSEKYSRPSRWQAIRGLGESEMRLFISYVGAMRTADIADRNNNPLTHSAIIHSIFATDQPTNIQEAVDRKKVPLGGAKPLQLVKHMFECGGRKLALHTYRLPPVVRDVQLRPQPIINEREEVAA